MINGFAALFQSALEMFQIQVSSFRIENSPISFERYLEILISKYQISVSNQISNKISSI